jgi:hypothetical protein
VHELYRHEATPDLFVDSPTEETHRMVIEGQTFELTKDKDVQEFLLRSINKSGQRSIFRKNNETSNRIYQQILK